MKNFHQNLLIILALGLCVLCVWQWHDQTVQRNQIDGLNLVLSQKLAAIQSYTNSIKDFDDQFAQTDARIFQLRGVIKTNDQLLLSQKRELNRVETQNESLSNQVSQYQQANETLRGKLKEAYDGIKKQNDAIEGLHAQRDEFVQKFNDSVKDRNAIVAKYNALVSRMEKSHGTETAPDK